MKLLVTDYDNTYELHYENFDLSKIFNTNYQAVDYFMRLKNKFAIATGRHFNAIKKTIDEKKLKFDYLITNNGAELYDENYKLIYSIPIDEQSLSTLKELENKLEIFYRYPNKSNLITSVNIYFENKDSYYEIKKFLEEKLVKCLIEYKYPKIKIINKNCNKINGIRMIEQIEKINNNGIYVIGDDINDLAMIRKYNGYSLNTANIKVKKISKKNYDSLSDFIEDIVIKE